MGEVYRAHDEAQGRRGDQSSSRRVLIGSERLQRFELEVEAAGTLNHPNILAIHEIETHDGAPYVVYELLEGETLRERLNGGALSPRKAIDYTLQNANGVTAAHDKAITHGSQARKYLH